MMPVQDYKDLFAWQEAMDLVVAVYRVTAAFPTDERFGLTSQLRRAAVSIPSNIAEGQGRGPTQDFVRFLHIARGSVQEVGTQIELAFRLGFLGDADRTALVASLTEIAKILSGLICSIPTE
jgi:four helix bundle protein